MNFLGKSRYIKHFVLLVLVPDLILLSLLTRTEIIRICFLFLALTPFSLLWDIACTKRVGNNKWIWDFNSETTIGRRIKGVPVEELILMFVGASLPIAIWEVLPNFDISGWKGLLIISGAILYIALICPVFSKYPKR
jgi:lycopene cyclase domain-containing protein